MKPTNTYPNIDMVQTGLMLKKYMDSKGMTVKDIQKYLCLSCPQPVYRWIKGKILPSVDHLLSLSELFGIHMEELIVKEQRDIGAVRLLYENEGFRKRIIAYYKMIASKTA